MRWNDKPATEAPRAAGKMEIFRRTPHQGAIAPIFFSEYERRAMSKHISTNALPPIIQIGRVKARKRTGISSLRMVACALLCSGSLAGLANAQSFDAYSLYDVVLASGADSWANRGTSFSGTVPGTGITITATSTYAVFASPIGANGLKQISWPPSGSSTPPSTGTENKWTFTISGGVSDDIRFDLFDFDYTGQGAERLVYPGIINPASAPRRPSARQILW